MANDFPADPKYPTPDIDTDSAGRGGMTIEPGVRVVNSISQDDYMDYSNKTPKPDGSGD